MFDSACHCGELLTSQCGSGEHLRIAAFLYIWPVGRVWGRAVIVLGTVGGVWLDGPRIHAAEFSQIICRKTHIMEFDSFKFKTALSCSKDNVDSLNCEDSTFFQNISRNY